MSGELLLQVDDLCVRYGQSAPNGQQQAEVVHALQSVHLELRRGEALALCGESGSGKSSLALALGRLLPEPPAHVSGQIRFGTKSLLDLPKSEMARIRGARMGFVFQEPLRALNPTMAAGEQIAEGLRKHLGQGRRAARTRSVEWMERLGIERAARRADDFVHQLSGGERQRVALAMALCLEPELIVADEPTAALDVCAARALVECLRELCREQDTALLFITHDLIAAAMVADRACVLRAGQVVESGDLRSVFGSPAQAYTRELIGALPERWPARADSTSSEHGAKDSSSSGAGAMLRATGLRVEQPGAPAGFGRRPTSLKGGPAPQALLHGADIELEAGRCTALVGESGSGKSTLARACLWLQVPTRGTVHLETRTGRVELGSLSARELRSLRPQMQLVLQDPFGSLTAHLCVGELLVEAARVHGLGAEPELLRKAAALLERVGLSAEAMERYPHAFSAGQRQRLAIVRALMLDPKLLVLDEPTSALDPCSQAQLMQLFGELRRERELTLLFVAHDLELVRAFADRVLVMQAGRIVEDRAAEALFHAPQHAHTRELLSARPRLADLLGHI